MQFDVLPDDVLLDIFDFYMDTLRPSYDREVVETWQTLVHVCRRWRSLVFGSPRRLDLRLVCTPKTCTRDPDTLDIWPALPLVVKGDMAVATGTDNVIAALGHSDRVCEVHLTNLALRRDQKVEVASAAMQIPFPELRMLWLHKASLALPLPVIPDSFLGGSAPRLQYINFSGIPFPGLPKLLSSTTHLVSIWLTDIPPSGYFSPDAMVASLSVLSSLESLHLGFDYPHSRPDWETRHPPPPKCSIIPALEHFTFSGNSEYLDDLVSGIDTPQLTYLRAEFFDQIEFDFRRLAQFISRAPKHRKLDTTYIRFDGFSADVLFGIIHVFISCKTPDRGLYAIAQVCDSFILSAVEDLYIERGLLNVFWKYNAIGDVLWTQLLLPFTAVKNLYLSKEFGPGIAAALQELAPGGRVTDVLPSLQNISVDYLESSFEQNIQQFVVARQLSGRPVAVSDWNKKP